MVTRSGFYVKGNLIIQRIVYIDWDLGFTKEAKHEYVRRVITELGTDVGKAVDVTSASPIYQARSLSPFYLKDVVTGKSVEDYLSELNSKSNCNVFQIPGLADYHYLRNLTEVNKETINTYDCFIDVFHNPDKCYGNTQALSLAVYKVLQYKGKLDLLELGTEVEFLDWYNTQLSFCTEVVD